MPVDGLGDMVGGLAGAQIAAIAEDGKKILSGGFREFGVRTRWRPEVSGVSGPTLHVVEDVEQMTLRHPGLDRCFERGESVRKGRLFLLFEMGLAVRIDRQFGVIGKTGIDLMGPLRQPLLERRDECRSVFGQPHSPAVLGQTFPALVPGEQLLAVVGVGLRPFHVDIATPQGLGEMGQHADFQRPPVERGFATLACPDKGLPALADESEIER